MSASAYAQAALDNECSAVSATTSGRNHRLNVAGHSLGQLIGAGALDRGEVERRLFAASEANGYVSKDGATATHTTIKSGLDKGACDPRRMPDSGPLAKPARPRPRLSGVPVPNWTPPGANGKPAFRAIGQDVPPPLVDEIRRHVYRRNGRPVRVKVKTATSWLNLYRVHRPDDGAEGWQAKQPAGFAPLPYFGPVGAFDPFDPECLGEVLFWPEGEKDVDALQRAGLVACTFGGASDVPNCAELLRGRDVIICGDNDEPGERCLARKVDMARGVAARVRVVRFAEMAAGSDVADWLDAGGTVDGLVARAEPPNVSQTPKPKGSPATVDAATLQGMTFAPIRYVVPGYIAEGCTILAGAPKLGKSWMVFDMAIAKATGGRCLGTVQTPEAEDVLYLALEDNLRRLQSRMDRLMPFGAAWPSRLTFATSWPRANDGGLDRIRDWARAAEKPRLVIIDVLQAFRPPVSPKDNAYAADYAAVRVLTELAAELNVAIVAVLHTRKSRDQVDPFDRVSGTLGLSGAADTALILDRDGQGVTLYGRGRDIPEIETAVQFDRDACRWSVMGRAAEVHQSDERKAVIDVLLVTAEPMTPVTIAEATGRPRNNIKQLLFKMLHKGEVVKTGKGAYAHPSRTDLLMSTPDNRDNQ